MSKGSKFIVFFKIVLKLLLCAAAMCIIIVAYYISKGYEMYRAAIDAAPLNIKIEQIRSDDNYISMEELPEFYIKAVICMEDQRFYDHHGIDIVSTCRAILVNLSAGGIEQGGSTITQQLAKNMYFTQEQVIERKIAELFVVHDLENNYDKDEIFELYVNIICFGSGYYGVNDASIGYFGKEPIELNDYQCAMLAGIPKAPAIYSPNANPDLAAQRAEIVLKDTNAFDFE